MARARNIKPGFFSNERLSDLDPLARLLFAGLWTIADRAGRLEDRPKRIKAQVLAYDECDVDPLLSALNEAGFILRYQVDGGRYIQVIAWDKHQNPHVKEVPSTIPAPCSTPTQHSASAGNSGTSPADSFNLIPDSLNLKPAAPCSTPREPEVKPLTADGKTFDLEACAERMYLIHPKKKDRFAVPQAIFRFIQRYSVDRMPEVEAKHAQLSRTEEWTKERGKYCPKLYEWLDDLALEPPKPKSAQWEPPWKRPGFVPDELSNPL